MIIEIDKIINPISASDGAGVKLKRSIGVEPNYFDPILMLDEFGSENSEDYIAGFPPHPHRGIETVTYMLAGDFEHKDSTGGEGKMTAGDVQWMKTGSGIIHSEMPAMKEGKLHEVYLLSSQASQSELFHFQFSSIVHLQQSFFPHLQCYLYVQSHLLAYKSQFQYLYEDEEESQQCNLHYFQNQIHLTLK